MEDEEKKIKLNLFKKTCFKFGITLFIIFVLRILGQVIASLFSQSFELSYTATYITMHTISFVFVDLLPLIVSFFVLKSVDNKASLLYKKPDNVGKSLRLTTPAFGLGQSINILTILIMSILAKIFEDNVEISESFKVSGSEIPENLACGLFFAFFAVIIAPIFEELIFRGVLYNALKPYGDAFAIFITAIFFGFMHGSAQMFFYTTAVGLVFGYARYATGSIFITTIMHFVFNSFSAVMVVFASTNTLQKTGVDVSYTDSEYIVISAYYIFLALFFAMMIVGFVSFIKRLKFLRMHRIKNVWSDIKGVRKILIFFTTVPVILATILALDVSFTNLLAKNLFRILGGEI